MDTKLVGGIAFGIGVLGIAVLVAHGQDQPAGPQTPTMFTNIEFQALVQGKSKADVVQAVGKPGYVTSGYFPGTQWYYYDNVRVIDRDTGVPTTAPVVQFDSNGIETDVKF